MPLFLEELTKAVIETSAEETALSTASSQVLASRPPCTLPSWRASTVWARRKAWHRSVLLSGGSSRTNCWLRWHRTRQPNCTLSWINSPRPGWYSGAERRPTLYLFKHALVQDAAYNTLLRRPRQQLHAKIARALEERFRIGLPANRRCSHIISRKQVRRPGRSSTGSWRDAGCPTLRKCRSHRSLFERFEGAEIVPTGAGEGPKGTRPTDGNRNASDFRPRLCCSADWRSLWPGTRALPAVWGRRSPARDAERRVRLSLRARRLRNDAAVDRGSPANR